MSIYQKIPLLAVVSSKMPAMALAALRSVVFATVVLPQDPLLSSPVASHPDMLIFSIGDVLVTHRQYYRIAEPILRQVLALTGMKLLLTDGPRSDVYPSDVALNGLLCGRYLFGRLDILADEIQALARENGITPVHVKQGYAGCSGLVVGETLCTADPSLTKAALAHKIPVVPVPDRDIVLPGYDHGFFGGCGGCTQEDVFLCGTPDPVKFRDFYTCPEILCRKLHFLMPSPLFDCGGIRLFSIK